MAAPALRAAVENCMQWEQYDTAIFLAERLFSEDPSPETIQLLAQCHFRSGHHSRAYSLLKGQTSLECRFLFARCCYLLNKLQEGELALTGALFPGSTTELKELNNTNGAAYALLGDICRSSSRSDHAIDCYRRSLEQNPFLWTSFEALCSLGARPDANEYFSVSDVKIDRLVDQLATSAADHSGVGPSVTTIISDAPLSYARGTPDIVVDTPGVPSAFKTPLLPGGTPTTPGIGSFSLAGSGATAPVPSALGSPMPWSYETPSPSGAAVTPDVPPGHTPKGPQTSVRRSSRIAKSAAKDGPLVRSRGIRLFSSRKDKGKEPSKLKEASTTKPQKKQKQHLGAADAAAAADPELIDGGSLTGVGRSRWSASTTSVDSVGLKESMVVALGLLEQLGAAMTANADFRCTEAIELLRALPQAHLNTGWTYCNIGKAYFELSKYKEADAAFRMARRLEPFRIEGMEIYSTTLWHLRQESALSYLAHEVTAADRDAPESWCVVGNCFSLQKEHDAAVKSLERAVQLDPSFAYAHTLLGHEYISNEDFSKALECFRSAVHHDARHYNAWYGIGMIYFRQERFELAEYHFQLAVDINPSSPILLVYLGLAQYDQQKAELALQNLDRAKELDNEHALVQFNRAMILAALDRNEDALEELQVLAIRAPKESSVYYLMGKIYRKLGQGDKALMLFSWSSDLDPKGNNNSIRDAINKHLPVEDDDDLDPLPLPLPDI
eukprot:m.20701 g.20701  ORF g.20701 m.20701 type:complete len:726 (+) comp10271_c0_seq1:41-2218(+)